jgi:hypothetical protein
MTIRSSPAFRTQGDAVAVSLGQVGHDLVLFRCGGEMRLSFHVEVGMVIAIRTADKSERDKRPAVLGGSRAWAAQ